MASPQSADREASALPRIDFAAVRSALRAGRAGNDWLARWLPAAYAAPEHFNANLYEYGRARPGGLKSAPGGTIDFYHDLVIAHLGAQRRACVCRAGGRALELSFDVLHARAGARASAWRTEGLEPGDTLAIVLPLASARCSVNSSLESWGSRADAKASRPTRIRTPRPIPCCVCSRRSAAPSSSPST
jgi:hypothetical protein